METVITIVSCAYVFGVWLVIQAGMRDRATFKRTVLTAVFWPFVGTGLIGIIAFALIVRFATNRDLQTGYERASRRKV